MPLLNAKAGGSAQHPGRSSPWLSFVFYLFFGAVHELIHIATVVVISTWHSGHSNFAADALFTLDGTDTFPGGGSGSTLSSTLIRAILGRYVILPNDSIEGDADASTFVLTTSRHAGWVGSIIIAVCLHVLSKTMTNNRHHPTGRYDMSAMIIAAYATAFEAVVTDLLGLVPQHPSASSFSYLFCGNFGVILLNSNWLNEDGGKTALDVMEKMIYVTMMRGAQCGGVVTFEDNHNASADGDVPQLTGLRSRVVNGKRTDLSKGIRRKVEKDACNPITGKLHGSDNTSFVKGFFGHTRFATTSKVAFDGCHPHQWTPKSKRRVYYPFSPKPTQKATRNTITMENYITHNGDLDFYQVNGNNFDLGAIQGWLEHATGSKMPTSVDSCAVAGMVDLLRTQGCFGLSARYAVSFGLSTSKVEAQPLAPLPTYDEYERIGMLFEHELDAMLPLYSDNLNTIASSTETRAELVEKVYAKILPELLDSMIADNDPEGWNRPYVALARFIEDEESGGASLRRFVEATVDAFFDQDLLQTTKEFLANAKGSFGLMISSSLDAHKQVCLAARGQSMSIAFYPKKGLICYGSEQAAVKAGLNYHTPGGDLTLDTTIRGSCEETRRLDLDDLGGEICLLDWHYKGEEDPWISVPNRGLKIHKLMSGKLNLAIISESKANKEAKHNMLHRRMTPLEDNEWIKPLPEEPDDLVGYDIGDIPRALNKIQFDWQEVGLNRLTAWNFSRAIESRLHAIASGAFNRHAGSVDILLTGCEVSLWMAEQFASDLQKAFPKLYIKSTSSNKLLSLYGQDLTVPCIGHPISEKTMDLQSPIVIIVSHSGGTFAPLACSNLLQSTSRNLFVVTSEWDTQVSKQLRQLYDEKEIISSRIFTTDVGVRPAEPCSVSVAATHQLLTNIFEHLCGVIISNTEFRHVSGAVITDNDLRILEKLNRMNIGALEEITGCDKHGLRLPKEFLGEERALRNVGDRFAEHVLEGVKAYIMSFIYIVVTVTMGYPLVSGIATAAGLTTDWAFYITRFIDSLIYFWLPQINIIILRLVQGRPLRHRMVARTVCIADVPWVAQASEAFLSKLFACSYSIAGLNVISGNPADHLVHRHTHRVVRGSLIVCGRPDGRLSALTSLEATVCLSVNQASSIQSLGSTAETVTIGHNPFTLPLSFRGIFLNDHRPKFLCETMLNNLPDRPISNDSVFSKNFAMQGLQTNTSLTKRRQSRRSLGWDDSKIDSMSANSTGNSRRSRRSQLDKDAIGVINANGSRRSMIRLGSSTRSSISGSISHIFKDEATKDEIMNISHHSFSSHALLGQYSDMQKGHATGNDDMGLTRMSGKAHSYTGSHTVHSVLADMMKEKAGIARLRKLFDEIDTDGSGTIDIDEFVVAMKNSEPSLTEENCRKIFVEADTDHSGEFSFHEFLALAKTPQADLMNTLQQRDRNRAGLSAIQPSEEGYFGEEFRKNAPSSVEIFQLAKSQHYAMELYEARIASLQRYVAFCVLFHQLGKRVQDFFPKISFGLLGYRMDRTHSIMRIATTASPVSGADVRERMEIMRIKHTINNAVATISRAWSKYLDRRYSEALNRSDNTLGSSGRRLGGSSRRLLLDSSRRRLDASKRSLGISKRSIGDVRSSDSVSKRGSIDSACSFDSSSEMAVATSRFDSFGAVMRKASMEHARKASTEHARKASMEYARKASMEHAKTKK